MTTDRPKKKEPTPARESEPEVGEPGKPMDPSKGTPKDTGYGPSHGNKPGHEGPTGPGDAPALPTKK